MYWKPIGFMENIKVIEANAWIEIFTELYISGENIEDAAYEAIEILKYLPNVTISGIESIWVFFV